MPNHNLLTAVRFDRTSGRPVLRDTKVPLSDIYDALKGGMAEHDVIAKWTKLQQSDVDAVFEFCGWEAHKDAISDGITRGYSIPVLLGLSAFVGHNHMVMPVNLMWLAAQIADHPGSEEALPTLRDMIIDTDKYDHHTRHIALRALRLIGGNDQDPATVQRACELLQHDHASNVRYEAVRVLADAGQVGCTPSMLEALDVASATDEDHQLRQYAAEAAEKLRQQRIPNDHR
jgi:uncharacterized protein (DUF433 family)